MEPRGILAVVPFMGRRSFPYRQARRKQHKMNVKLYVGNLPRETTQAGEVALTDILMDWNNGESRGFAFVTMSTQGEAEKAIHMFNAYSLNEQELKVNIAKPKRN